MKRRNILPCCGMKRLSSRTWPWSRRCKLLPNAKKHNIMGHTMHIPIRQFGQHIEEEVVVAGWVYNTRSSGKIIFLQLRDGSGFTQAIVSQTEVPGPVWNTALQLT